MNTMNTTFSTEELGDIFLAIYGYPTNPLMKAAAWEKITGTCYEGMPLLDDELEGITWGFDCLGSKALWYY